MDFAENGEEESEAHLIVGQSPPFWLSSWPNQLWLSSPSPNPKPCLLLQRLVFLNTERRVLFVFFLPFHPNPPLVFLSFSFLLSLSVLFYPFLSCSSAKNLLNPTN
jgi:hypothetical protein